MTGMETPKEFVERLGSIACQSQFEVCAMEYYRDMDSKNSKAQEAIKLYLEGRQEETREYRVTLIVEAYFEAEDNEDAELQFWDTFHNNPKDLNWEVISEE